MLQTNLKGPLTLAGIVIGLSLIFGIGGSFFLAGRLSSEAKAVSDARIASARASTLGPRITALKAQEARAAVYTRVISLLMPTQEQLLEVPRAIEALGTAQSVTAHFQFLGSPPPGATGKGASLPFNLSANGTTENLTAFLEDLEIKNPRYIVNINSVEMSLANEVGGARLSATGDVYYQ